MPTFPPQFAYVAEVAAKYGKDEVQISTTIGPFIDSLDEDDFAALAATYREIERRGDAEALSDYVRCKDANGSRRVQMLLFLFGHLGEREIEPFSSGSVRYVAEDKPRDWTKLPPSLRYLAEPAEKYGKYQFDAEVDQFIETMTAEQRQELKDLVPRIEADEEMIDDFIDRYPMTEHPESALIYFMWLLMAHINDRGGFDDKCCPPLLPPTR